MKYLNKGTLFIRYSRNCQFVNNKLVSFKNIRSREMAKQIVDSRTRTEKGKTPANISKAWFVPYVGMEVFNIPIMQ